MTPTETTPPVFPPGRYGRRRDPASNAGAAGLPTSPLPSWSWARVAIAVKLYRQYAQAPYQVTIVNVQEPSDRGVTVTFDVDHAAWTGRHAAQCGRTRGRRIGRRAQVDVPPARAARP